jgi:hypothetical protein
LCGVESGAEKPVDRIYPCEAIASGIPLEAFFWAKNAMAGLMAAYHRSCAIMMQRRVKKRLLTKRMFRAADA